MVVYKMIIGGSYEMIIGGSYEMVIGGTLYKKMKKIKRILSKLGDKFKKVFEKIDEILKDCEMQIFTFTSSKSLDIFLLLFALKSLLEYFVMK